MIGLLTSTYSRFRYMDAYHDFLRRLSDQTACFNYDIQSGAFIDQQWTMVCQQFPTFKYDLSTLLETTAAEQGIRHIPIRSFVLRA